MKTERKTTFEMPYVGIDHYQGMSVLYGDRGDFSVVMRLTNPVLQYGADPEAYTVFQQVLLNVIKILGEGHIIQKHDVFIKRKYRPKPASEFLEQKYQEHFEDREYTEIRTYLTVTRQVKKGAFYTYDKKVLVTFGQNMAKVHDLLLGAALNPSYLTEAEINRFVNRVLGMEFEQPHITLDNLRCEDRQLQIGDRAVRCISMVNTDSVDLPEKVGSFTARTETNGMRDFPVDNLFFLHHVPGYRTIIYNQLLEIPSQQITLGKLEVKRKRHSSVPDPANLMCVEDIDRLLVDVARDNQLLVHAHYSMIVCADTDKIDKTANFIEAALFQQGIIPSRNAYNQLELFRCALPGVGVELKKYDWFLTTADAALCFFFKERLPTDEPSEFLLRFTDRQGVPVAIDPSDLVMRTGRIKNRNRFVLGASGTGKSYAINTICQQYLQYNMDVVIVDVGHSYSGLCSTYGGKYITYSEEKPITMNPFAISEEEYNIEKKDFLITLICLLWKGAEGTVTTVERDVISNVISAYYAHYFDKATENRIDKLDFNSFYEFAVRKIPDIRNEESIAFDVEEFRFVLKKFYRGGEYEAILNEDADQSLFNEQFIVYEIDNIQNNKTLLPIVTLIIMDLFVQKMRHRKNRRKTLILEEAWRAISSPMMANFLLYLNKTVRKFWGEIIEVTQEINDIIGNPIIKDSIINNSDTIILLQQNEADFRKVAELLSINEAEQKKIFTINRLDNKDGRARFNEFYIRRGNVGEVYGVEVSIYHHLAFTTEKPEKSAVEIYAKHHGSYPAALTAFVSDMEKSGLALGDFVQKVNQNNAPVETSREYFKPDFT
ncbi:TraG family conjugative transposon ATPase [Sphingobacterium sp. CZ-2]|uniref:TraG family conjugative transposon ATPase n=1 Tax=Sphingobacterium sp. CZ-2 TaxID=2557994 RepID=UPI00106F4D19|nr:TraG family conjugative transposon ATPase [Sphingobacterium sp. CZ-2]QBR11606.1 TraG family conjugative transposon ATPase [Sphingobacterium sp. CZ-2]